MSESVVVDFPNSSPDGFTPVLSKTQMEEVERNFRKDKVGLNRRILLSVLTCNFDQLRADGVEPETVLKMFEYGMEYLEQRDLFTQFIGTACYRLAWVLTSVDLDPDQEARFEPLFEDVYHGEVERRP